MALYPFIRTAWGGWKKQHPHALVLKPLPGYAELMPMMNRIIDRSRLGAGPAPRGAPKTDGRLPPREMVAGLEVGREAKAYPLPELRKTRVVNDTVGGTPVLMVHQPNSDTTTAFEARAKKRTLRFEPVDAEASRLLDLETRSTWNAYGLCLSGPLHGAQLKPFILVPEFWFAWSEFHPRTNVYRNGAAH